MLVSRNVKKFDTLSFNSAFYQSAIASRRNEEIESYRRWMLIKSSFQYFFIFFFLFFFLFFLNHLSISVGFVFFWESAFPLFCMSKNDFQSNVKHISLQSASRLVSHRKITPSKVRTIRKFCQKFEEMGKVKENLVGLDWWERVKGERFFFSGGQGRVSKSSLHDQTYGFLFFSYSSSPSSSSSSYRIFFCLFFLFIHLLYFYSSSSYSSSS